MAVLGPVEVRRDGVQVPIPGGKATELLVRLALVAGVRVRTERLIDDLWSDEGRRGRAEHVAVEGVEAAPGPGDPALLTGDPSGYTLNIDPGSVDALRCCGWRSRPRRCPIGITRWPCSAARCCRAGERRGGSSRTGRGSRKPDSN